MSELSPKRKEWLRRSCEASGVPVVITDPTVLATAAETLRQPSTAAVAGTSRKAKS